MCVLTAPDVFDQAEDDGRVVVLVDELASPRVDDVRQAVDLCPSGALSVFDEGSLLGDRATRDVTR
jgi:ferredoxin